ncbi:H-NS family nucleoid-associated regulatory protein [Methylogaea oryzae]|uniref:H-NS family nucleoid-associated regulatory protein n=1 Tax=Methylogaea oryzae TaxID=1295382 RepID=UPI00278C6D16|nr:H-NS family nucleoid-associated regulatory protein [Methylogaea oryzae]
MDELTHFEKVLIMEQNLNVLSETQLQEVIENAHRALRDKQQSRRKEVFAEIRRLAASVGVTVEISEGDKRAAPPVRVRLPRSTVIRPTRRKPGRAAA